MYLNTHLVLLNLKGHYMEQYNLKSQMPNMSNLSKNWHSARIGPSNSQERKAKATGTHALHEECVCMLDLLISPSTLHLTFSGSAT